MPLRPVQEGLQRLCFTAKYTLHMDGAFHQGNERSQERVHRIYTAIYMNFVGFFRNLFPYIRKTNIQIIIFNLQNKADSTILLPAPKVRLREVRAVPPSFAPSLPVRTR